MKEDKQLLLNFKFNKSYSKDDFFVSESNFFAFNLIDTWPRWEKNIINVCGEKYSGKTHLAKIFSKKSKCKVFDANNFKYSETEKLRFFENIILDNFDDEIEKYDIESFGPIIENNHLFPEKINVSFAKLANKNNILLNVWERGAGRTKACGTAACASTIAGVELGILENKVTVTLPGGDLEIYYERDSNVIMTGPTEINFTDKFKL